jgi:hypothetical protein
MHPKEEELERRKKSFSNYVVFSSKELDDKLKATDKTSQAFGDMMDAFQKLSQSNEKGMLEYRDNYKRFFLDGLKERKDYRSQYEFVFEQVRDLRLKISDAKAARHERYQKRYEDTLNDVVLPVMNDLQDMIRLENEVGKLREISVPPLEKDDASDNHPEVSSKDKPPVIEIGEILIPVSLEEKPLTTKSGKPLNNPKHIEAGRKFRFEDERIPDLIGDFLLEKGCIFDFQLQTVKDFFRTSRSDRKIIFHGKANQLTTILYDLKNEKYTHIFSNHLGELIEAIFVTKDNTQKALITVKSLIADLRPGNVQRRTKSGSPYHLDILSYLREKMQNPA